MQVLVLGGSQFIGRAIVDALLSQHDVTVLNRGSRPPRDPRIGRLVADRTDQEQLAAVLTSGYDVVVDVSGTEPQHVANVLRALPTDARTRYVFISSASVYNRRYGLPPFHEDQRADGDTMWGAYGRAKAACEAALTKFPGDLVVLRPPYVYGPRNNEQREQFLWARIVSGLPVFVPGDGSSRIQFCHAEDLALAVVAACEGRLRPGTYNVGEPRDYSFHEYLSLLGEAAGGKKTRTVEVGDGQVPAREYFPFRQADLTLDVRRLMATGAVAPRTLASGLEQTFAWFRDHDGIRYEPTSRERQWRATLT